VTLFMAVAGLGFAASLAALLNQQVGQRSVCRHAAGSSAENLCAHDLALVSTEPATPPSPVFATTRWTLVLRAGRDA
jgi:hypothetical protein